MLRDIQLHPDKIDLVMEGPEDFKKFSSCIGINPHIYHLHGLSRDRQPLEVIYHVPEGASTVYEQYREDLLGKAEKGEKEYRITLAFPAPSTKTSLPAPGENTSAMQFFYEDIKYLADQLAKDDVKLASPEQREKMIAAARGLEADQTLFYRDKKRPLFTIDTHLGGFNLRMDRSHPDYRAERMLNATKALYELSPYSSSEPHDSWLNLRKMAAPEGAI